MSIFTYTKDYKAGFKAAYILGPSLALKQIHKWEQDESDLEKDYQDAKAHESPEAEGTADRATESEDADKVG